MKLLFECSKVSVFVLNKRLHTEFFDFSSKNTQNQSSIHHDHVPLDKQKYVHSVDYHDEFSIDRNKVLAIARSEEELCKKLVFPSIIKIHKDTMRKKEQMAVVIRSHKKDGDISCIL